MRKILTWIVSISLIFILTLSSKPFTVSSIPIVEKQTEVSINEETNVTCVEDWWEPTCTNATYEEKQELLCFPEQPVNFSIPENAIYYDDGSIYIPPDPPDSTCEDDDPIVYVCLLIDEEIASFYG